MKLLIFLFFTIWGFKISNSIMNLEQNDQNIEYNDVIIK